ncbi:MAG: nitrate reductase [Rhodospirillales bacterium]|nr:nitrate reductase [Rhodospirillales bacterium]
MSGAVTTTCPYCGVGCGVRAEAGGARIGGDAAHPNNHGRLCSKGAALGATLGAQGRLLRPRIEGRGASWEEAMALIGARFAEAIAAYGPDSVAFYVSGQFLTEDYYVANKLMKGFIGSANIDTNSRLCMASSVAGHVRAFGEDVVPGIYEDWDQADLVVLIGSNAAWCHPVLHQRLRAARETRGTRIVVIDPRRTASVEGADLHLAIAPGSDVALFNGLLCHLAARRRIDTAWVGRHARGLEDALAAAARGGLGDVAIVAAECGIDPEAVETFFDWFAATERVLSIYSQGVNQSRHGTDKVNAIINCHLATGRIGRAGMGPFSVTGQPNAMGGREVGGLANQLAAHLPFTDPIARAALQDFWQSPRLPAKPGLQAVDLFRAVAAGRIKALWIAGTNPAASMPEAGLVRAALAACPFVVVADCWEGDTTDYAHVLLPAAGWGEKDGTVTASDRRISRQRRFRPPPGEARTDWWMFAELARRLGHGAAFAWRGPHEIFAEHAALSAIAGRVGRVFDLAGLTGMDKPAYDALAPIRWPVPEGATQGAGRLFAEGGFPTPDGRARLVATPLIGRPRRAAGEFLLNTGRVRDQWHTMTRTGAVPALMTHTATPRISIHPADAAALGIAADTLVQVENGRGSTLLAAEISHAQRRGEVFAPMHWTDRFHAAGPVARLVSAEVDAHSGQPDLKASPVRLRPVAVAMHGRLLRLAGRALPGQGRLPGGCHWVRTLRAQADGGRIEAFRLAVTEAPAAGAAGALAQALAAALLGPDGEAGDAWLEAEDAARGVLRIAVLRAERLIAVLLLAAADHFPPEAALAARLGTVIAEGMRTRLLGGLEAIPEEEAQLCVCFGVGRQAIAHAIATRGIDSVAEIGAAVKAGTNCGSCVPELQAILAAMRQPAMS